MEVNLKKIGTEQRNVDTINIDTSSTIEILTKINNEDQKVAFAVKEVLPKVAELVDKLVAAFYKYGSLIYM